MDFNANQMRQDALLPEGKYHFRVLDAREKRSIAGNDILNLSLELTVSEGKLTKQWDSLILLPKMFWKIEHFCEAVGLSQKLEEGRIMAQDCLSREGHLYLIQKQNQQSGIMENVVKDYCSPDVVEPKNDDIIAEDEDVPNFV